MGCFNVKNYISDAKIIPAARNIEDFKYALQHSVSPSVILLFGDINTLPSLLAQAQQHKKRLMVHFDLLDGIGKDKAGISYIARLGVHTLLTTKSQLCKYAHEEGLMVIQRVFLMDSEAVKTCLQIAKSAKPDVIEMLPATVPAGLIQKIANETGLPLIAGGLLNTPEEVQDVLSKGVCAISTAKKELWK